MKHDRIKFLDHEYSLYRLEVCVDCRALIRVDKATGKDIETIEPNISMLSERLNIFVRFIDSIDAKRMVQSGLYFDVIEKKLESYARGYRQLDDLHGIKERTLDRAFKILKKKKLRVKNWFDTPHIELI